MNALNATQLSTLKWWVLCYVNVTQLKKILEWDWRFREWRGLCWLEKSTFRPVRKHAISFSISYGETLPWSHAEAHEIIFLNPETFWPYDELVKSHCSSGAWHTAFNIFLPFGLRKQWEYCLPFSDMLQLSQKDCHEEVLVQCTGWCPIIIDIVLFLKLTYLMTHLCRIP